MTLPIRLSRLLLAGALAGVAAASLSQAAQARPPQGPVVPSEIAVEAGNQLYLTGHALGVQIYSCNATATGPAWTFVAPRANLFDDRGKLIITHFAGPTWQANDGSAVVGTLVKGVPVDATAIPWLLLSTKPTAKGQLAKTTFIQRIRTRGGLVPAASTCDAKTVGTRAEVPYSADYLFYKKDCGRRDD